MIRTAQQERADTIALLERIVRGCERFANEQPHRRQIHNDTKRVFLAAIEDIRGGIHEGESDDDQG